MTDLIDISPAIDESSAVWPGDVAFTRSVQCDMQLDGLTNHDEEMQDYVEELKEQILSKNFEIKRLKV